MAGREVGEYLPGDPRYGKNAEQLKDFYRSKPAQWAIYCWDKEGALEDRSGLLQDQKNYLQRFGDQVIGYGHFITDDGLETLGTSYFIQLGDRAAAEEFIANEPMNQAGVYDRVDFNRWSNSFQKRQADYARKGLQQFLCTGSKISDSAAFFATHLNDHEKYFAGYGDRFIFRGPIRSADGADNIGTALMLELADRAAADDFWNNKPFAAHGGYQDDARIYRWVFGD